MIIPKDDILYKYIDKIDLQEETLFFVWKKKLLNINKGFIVVKLLDSNYILVTDKIDSQINIVAIWDSMNSTGGILNTPEIIKRIKSDNFFLKDLYTLNPIDKFIFGENSDSNFLEEKALQVLKILLNSPHHSNKSEKELAIKALRIAIEFKQNLQSVIDLYKEN